MTVLPFLILRNIKMNRLLCDSLNQRANLILISSRFKTNGRSTRLGVDTFLDKFKNDRELYESYSGQIEYLKMHNFCVSDIKKSELKSLLKPNKTVLHSKVKLMEECGIVKNVKNLLGFEKLFDTDIEELKLDGAIDVSVSITQNLLLHLDSFPYVDGMMVPTKEALAERFKPGKRFHRPKVKAKYLPWSDADLKPPKNTPRGLYEAVARQYYAWRCCVDIPHVDKLMFVYFKFARIISLQLLRKTFDILENDLHMPAHKIASNFFVLQTCPSRLEDLVHKYPTLYGEPLDRIALAFPRVVTHSSEHIADVIEVLQEFGITDEQIRCQLDVFTLNGKTVRERLTWLKNDADLSVYCTSSRFLQIVMHFKKVEARQAELKKRNLTCVTQQTLCGMESVFQSYLVEGTSKVYRICDAARFIQHELCVHGNEAKSRLLTAIGRHSLRYYIPLTEIKATLDFLRKLGFTSDVIAESPTILFYPKEKISSTLEAIADRSGQLQELGFDNGFVEKASPLFKCGASTNDRRLALCLYYMEKIVHFTGEGGVPHPS